MSEFELESKGIYKTKTYHRYLYVYYGYLLGHLDYNRFKISHDYSINYALNISYLVLALIILVYAIICIFGLESNSILFHKILQSNHIFAAGLFTCNFLDGFENNKFKIFDWWKLGVFVVDFCLLIGALAGSINLIYDLALNEAKYLNGSKIQTINTNNAIKNSNQMNIQSQYSINENQTTNNRISNLKIVPSCPVNPCFVANESNYILNNPGVVMNKPSLDNVSSQDKPKSNSKQRRFSTDSFSSIYKQSSVNNLDTSNTKSSQSKTK